MIDLIQSYLTTQPALALRPSFKEPLYNPNQLGLLTFYSWLRATLLSIGVSCEENSDALSSQLGAD